jgi:hypothetical protein
MMKDIFDIIDVNIFIKLVLKKIISIIFFLYGYLNNTFNIMSHQNMFHSIT